VTKIFEKISEPVKGALLILAGLALLLHTFGILKEILYYALIAMAIYLIIVGFVKIGGVEQVKCVIKKKDDTKGAEKKD